VICLSGQPLDVIADTSACWITAQPDAPLPYYVCVVAKVHVNEPYDLSPSDQASFWHDAMTVAEAIAGLCDPIKINYEIHGNTLPHLHLHIFPRHIDDPYVGGPIDPRLATFVRNERDIERIAAAVRDAFSSAQFNPSERPGG
jgi:diadenosine tetraphosphate (Ap4A) HIT family hydrolase